MNDHTNAKTKIAEIKAEIAMIEKQIARQEKITAKYNAKIKRLNEDMAGLQLHSWMPDLF